MPSIVLTDMVASITELKTNPMATFNAAEGNPIAILNRNEPAFYCVPPSLFEHFMELVEDAELARIVQEREFDEEISITIEELRDGLRNRL